MASTQPHLKVLETSQLTPPPSLLHSPLPLNFFDIHWLYAGAVERIFFFPSPCSISDFTNSIFPKLKSSLSQALNIFYPLYGKIRRTLQSDKQFELRYVDGDSVSFIVAQLNNEDFDELSSYDARDLKRLLPLRPRLIAETGDEAKPVLAIQVTLFPNQGITIGIAVHHAACDGHSSMKFFSTWASIYRTGTSSFSPLFDRTLISDPKDLYSTYLRCWLGVSLPPETNSPPDNMFSRTITLTSAQIQRLKKAVTAKAIDGSQIRCSTTILTYAMAWVCSVRARNLLSEQTAHFAFAANCSNGLSPTIPSEYFGNRIRILFVQVNAGELIQGVEGIVAAAKAISEVVEKFRENALDGAERVFDEWRSVVARRPLSVAGSPQLKVYGIDFGWGKPKKVEVTSIVETGAMSVAESRDDEGGVEIGFILQKDEMDQFATQFSIVLQMLSDENDL